MIRLYCLLIGYCFGLFMTSYFYGRLNGIDIREHGSGNAGSTNMLRTLGKKAGIITFAGDVGKCVIAMVIIRYTFGRQYPEMLILLLLYGAAGVILGHNYPFYLGFRGGKGMACTAGLSLGLHWMFPITGFIIFMTNYFVTHYVSLGSMLVYVGFTIQIILMCHFGIFGATLAPQYYMEACIIMFLLGLLAIWRHRSNIGRLIRGNENKMYVKKTKA